ncbi:hypothetical protein ABPG72_014007 [Tetrahymena utriculariae]
MEGENQLNNNRQAFRLLKSKGDTTKEVQERLKQEGIQYTTRAINKIYSQYKERGTSISNRQNNPLYENQIIHTCKIEQHENKIYSSSLPTSICIQIENLVKQFGIYNMGEEQQRNQVYEQLYFYFDTVFLLPIEIYENSFQKKRLFKIKKFGKKKQNNKQTKQPKIIDNLMKQQGQQQQNVSQMRQNFHKQPIETGSNSNQSIRRISLSSVMSSSNSRTPSKRKNSKKSHSRSNTTDRSSHRPKKRRRQQTKNNIKNGQKLEQMMKEQPIEPEDSLIYKPSLPNQFQIYKEYRDGEKKQNIDPQSMGIESIANSTEYNKAIERAKQNQYYDLHNIIKTKEYRNDELQQIVNYQNPQLDTVKSNNFIMSATLNPLNVQIQEEHMQKLNNLKNEIVNQKGEEIQEIYIVYNISLWNRENQKYKLHPNKKKRISQIDYDRHYQHYQKMDSRGLDYNRSHNILGCQVQTCHIPN